MECFYVRAKQIILCELNLYIEKGDVLLLMKAEPWGSFNCYKEIGGFGRVTYIPKTRSLNDFFDIIENGQDFNPS